MNNCLAEVNVRDIRASKQSKVVLAASESLISYPLITRERRRVTGHTPAAISVCVYKVMTLLDVNKLNMKVGE